ncbi:MAG: uvrY [Gammaproteobacteria bacterium]|nr:uvrY [Gammaproteobacteria bacterium]MCE3238449.1 uvrY [Gammaproteobacteria bacterium]
MIKILIVEDHALIRAAIKQLLTDVPGFKVIGEAETGEEGVRLAKELMPDIVLLDIQLIGIDGLEAANKMIRYNPDIKILILTVHGNEPYPSRLLEAGVAGYITKGCAKDEMIHAIRIVHSGQNYISNSIAQQLALKSSGKLGKSELNKLSERELQIMIMIVHGEETQEISEKLHITPKTVNTYRYRIFKKLGMSSNVELTLLAARFGIIKGCTATTL